MRIAKLPLPALVGTLILCAALTAGAQVNISGNVYDGAGGPLLSGTVYHASSLSIPAGETLTVQAGAIVKFGFGVRVTAAGTLDVQGTSGNPAIFTSLTDDSAGGDTNMNGPSTGNAGYWRGLDLQAPAALAGLELRYAGQSNYAAIDLPTTPGTTITNCVLSDFFNSGIEYGGGGTATVTGCSFLNGSRPVVNCPVSELAGFTNNTASGNSTYNSVEIQAGTVGGTQLIPAASVMGGAHLINGSLTFDVGSVITIEAGIVFKWKAAGSQLSVDGTLLCNGTTGSQIVFTDLRDDVYGGDTNNNGMSNGSKGFWRGIYFGAGADASVLNNIRVRFGGQSSFSAISLDNTDLIIENSTIEHCFAVGIDHNVASGASHPVIVNSHFDDVSIPMDEVAFSAMPNFSGNTATNCTTYDAIRVTESTVPTSVAIGGDNCPNGVLLLGTNCTVPSGVNLTLDQGLVVKFQNTGSQLSVQGTLDCQGSGGAEIVFTTLLDDAFGGDTNTNGPSTSSPGYWRGILLEPGSDASSLTYARVRFGGQSFFPGIRINDSNCSLTNCVIEDCFADALSLNDSNAMPTVSGCAFDRCSIAVDDIHLDSVVGFTNNSASGNSARDCIQVTGSTLSSSFSLTTANQINGAFDLAGNLTIDPGVTLMLGEGLVFKQSVGGARVNVNGTLTCMGTLAQPVVFTMINDDAYGGDTNLDGAASLPNPGYWRGLAFNAGSDASVLDKTIVSYCGQSFFPGIGIYGADITLFECLVQFCFDEGIGFGGMPSKPSIRRCLINDNAYALRDARWINVSNLRDCQATGNSASNATFIDHAAVDSDVVVDQRAIMGGAFVTSVSPNVAAGQSLTFERGCIVKFSNAGADLVSNDGIINVHGTGAEPVVFTAIADDEYGGDTNMNGASTGAPAFWRGIRMLNATQPAKVEHAILRYCGSSFFPACEVDSSLATVNAVRVDHAFADGFRLLDAAGPLDNLVVYSCGQDGIEIEPGFSQDIRFATVTGCVTGFNIDPSYNANIQSTISWGNTTNFVGATAMNLFDSNGEMALVGTNGNIDVDPLFVDATPGVANLELQSTSPCIDAASFGLGLTVAGDFYESSRVNDHDLDGNVGADMGAYEYCNWYTTFTGRPVIGESMFFTFDGTMPALTVVSVALLDFEYYYPPYGMVLCGSPLTLQHQDIWFVGVPYQLPIPNDPFAVGYNIGVQIGAAPYGNLDVGNIANLWRGQIQD